MLNNKEIAQIKPSQPTLAKSRNPREVIDILSLLRWAYQDEAADAVASRAAGASSYDVRSTLGAVERQGALGARVDCSRVIFVDMPADAEAVHEAVLSLRPRRLIGTVIDYAKTGCAPDWMEGEEPKPLPILRANGKPCLEYFDAAKTRPAYCLLRYDPEPDHLAFVRGVYEAWWDAVTSLVPKLQGLERYVVTGLDLPREPWSIKTLDAKEEV